MYLVEYVEVCRLVMVSALESASERILSGFTNFFVIFRVFCFCKFGNLKEDPKVVLGQKGIRWIEFVEIYPERSCSELENALDRILSRNTRMLT